MRNALIILAAVVALVACSRIGTDGDGSFGEFVDLPESGWAYSAPQLLAVTPADSGRTVVGELSVVVTHDNSYPYSNLWLELSTPVSDSVLRRDTVDVRLADVYGRWYGTGIGAAMQCRQVVDSAMTVYGGRPVLVRHIMRVDTLSGISRIGIMFHAK